MNFDLRPHYPLLAGDGQINNSEGVTPDEWENCTFEALRETLRAYGYRNLPDDEQMRQMIDPGSHGGEPWSKTQALAAKLAPGLPTAIEYPADVVAAIAGYGRQGFVVHVGFWCDTNAWVPAQSAVVASHAEVALWDDGSGQGFRNVWPHPNYHLTYDQVRSLYDSGGVLVFKRALEADMTDAQAALLGDIYNFLRYGQSGQVQAYALSTVKPELDAIKAAIANLSGSGGGGLTADQAAQLSSVAAAVSRLEAAFKGA